MLSQLAQTALALSCKAQWQVLLCDNWCGGLCCTGEKRWWMCGRWREGDGTV